MQRSDQELPAALLEKEWKSELRVGGPGQREELELLARQLEQLGG